MAAMEHSTMNINGNILHEHRAVWHTETISMEEWKKCSTETRFMQQWFDPIAVRANSTSAFQQGLAARYAAKKAILKLCPGYPDIHRLEIKNKQNGQPYLAHSTPAQSWLRENEVEHILISLSHTKKYATAMAVVSYTNNANGQ